MEWNATGIWRDTGTQGTQRVCAQNTGTGQGQHNNNNNVLDLQLWLDREMYPRPWWMGIGEEEYP